jgi:Protein of unknown function (DUF3667)
MASLITCKNCGNHFSGKYCNQCGEKVYTDHDKSLKHIFEEVFHFVTHFDSKFFTTLRLIFARPGFISQEYCRGVRKKYFKPVSLFLIGVIIYLLFPIIQGLNISFFNHLAQDKQFHISFPQAWAQAKATHYGISIEDLGLHFDDKSPKISKLLLFIIIPLTGIILKLLFYKRKRFSFDHFVLAAEINTFFVFLTFLLMPLLFQLIAKIVWWVWSGIYRYGDDIYFILTQLVLVFLFSAIAFKRFYGVSTWKAILKSLLFLFAHSVLIYIIYRLILFCVVMLFI